MHFPAVISSQTYTEFVQKKKKQIIYLLLLMLFFTEIFG